MGDDKDLIRRIAYATYGQGNQAKPAGLGLTLHQRSEEFVAFQGGGGYVTVTATRTAEDDRTTVDLESREWDYPVRQFLGEI